MKNWEVGINLGCFFMTVSLLCLRGAESGAAVEVSLATKLQIL